MTQKHRDTQVGSTVICCERRYDDVPPVIVCEVVEMSRPRYEGETLVEAVIAKKGGAPITTDCFWGLFLGGKPENLGKRYRSVSEAMDAA